MNLDLASICYDYIKARAINLYEPDVNFGLPYINLERTHEQTISPVLDIPGVRE
jgi:hypothetical protein